MHGSWRVALHLAIDVEMTMICRILALLSLLTQLPSGSSQMRSFAWSGRVYTLAVVTGRHSDEKVVTLSWKKGGASGRIVLIDRIPEVGPIRVLRGRHIEVILQTYRSIYWFRMSNEGKIRPMKVPWQTDCDVIASGSGSVIVACQPLGTDTLWYYVYNPCTEQWLKLRHIVHLAPDSAPGRLTGSGRPTRRAVQSGKVRKP